MRRICQQSRRWHQQVFLASTALPHRSLLQQRRLPTRHQCRSYARKRPRGDDDLVVHEFEQQGSDKSTRVPVDRQAELEEVKQVLKSELERLDEELAEMKEGPFGPNSELIRSLPPEERQLVLETMRKEGQTSKDELGDLNLEELDYMIKDDQARTEKAEYDLFDHEAESEVTLKPSRQHQAYVQAFNASFKAFRSGQPTEAKAVTLWRSYQRCLRRIPNFLTLVPAKAWDVLWQSQIELADNDTNVQALAHDMLLQSLPLSPAQLMGYMRSLRSTGDLSAAIECWKSNQSILGPNAEVAREFWALGIQLYSENDDPMEAQKIALQCLDQGAFADATILIPVITAWARASTTKDNMQKAWACYLRFKAELGTSIRPQDYESISSTLLKQGVPDMALSVFKDLLLDWAKCGPAHNSLSAFRAVVGHVEEMQSSAINEHEVSKISLAALTVLPRFLQNKYFFASWIKNLLGRGEVEAAVQVVELMYERRVKPDAKHLNGVVAAWLREGQKGSAEKAEKMAWAMINARIEFVRQRQGESNEDNVACGNNQQVVGPLFVRRPVPSATIETFSILLLHYTRGCKDTAAEQLMDTMTKQALIAPNSFIYNHWMYASLRVHDIQKVWATYQTMRSHRIAPDLETFACLWDTAKVQFDRSKSAHYKDFPSARALFREMKDWARQLDPKRLTRIIRSDFSRDHYDQIIRVFSLSHDLRGTLCALHGLRHLFDQYPDPVTSRIIVIQIGRLLPADAGQRATGRRGTRRRIEGMRTAMTAVNDILQLVTDQRALGLMDRHDDDDDDDDDDGTPLSPHRGSNSDASYTSSDDDAHPPTHHPLDHLTTDPAAAKQFRLDVLSDLLVVVLKRIMALSPSPRSALPSSTSTPSPTTSTSLPANNSDSNANDILATRLQSEIRMVAQTMGLAGAVDHDHNHNNNNSNNNDEYKDEEGKESDDGDTATTTTTTTASIVQDIDFRRRG